MLCLCLQIWQRTEEYFLGAFCNLKSDQANTMKCACPNKQACCGCIYWVMIQEEEEGLREFPILRQYNLLLDWISNLSEYLQESGALSYPLSPALVQGRPSAPPLALELDACKPCPGLIARFPQHCWGSWRISIRFTDGKVNPSFKIRI